MKQDEASCSMKSVMRNSAKACLVAAVALALGLSVNESAQATTGDGGSNPPKPYEVPKVKNGSILPKTVETYIVADEATVDIGDGNGVATNVMAFMSCSDSALTDCTTPGIPGPEFRLNVGDHVIVHFVNNLNSTLPSVSPEGNVSGIHWHGIELNNLSDGTQLTQPAVSPGGTFDYDFIVKRPGIFWYHPHHHSSTNQVFKGLYGSLIVEDPYAAPLRTMGVIPSQTKTLVLSDITVCNPGNNPATFADGLPHVSGVTSWQLNYQNHVLTQSPSILCDLEPMDANGVSAPGPYGFGDVPNVQSPEPIGRMSEGFTVLTNGVQVDARGGTPSNPGSPSASVLNNALEVQAGQGLRLQIVNPSPVRYMRLRLTDTRGWQIPLVRIGGEGGLLNNARVEGGLTASNFSKKYDRGEILLPPASRADVVAEIPASAEQDSVLTMWTEDFQRVAATYSWTPTVPVMHMKVTGSAATKYHIGEGMALRASFGLQAMVQVLRGAMDDLVNPAGETGVDGAPAGSSNPDIQLTFLSNIGVTQPSIDGIPMTHDFTGGVGTLPYNPFYLASARHAILANTMELMVTNMTEAHHPFHLHGFSFQPISLTPRTGMHGPTYTFSPEFLDIMDVPAHSTLKFRVSLQDRPAYGASDASGVGGGNGRWLFHCHILPHATFGMTSELHVGAH